MNAYTIAGVKDPSVFNTARQMQIAALHNVNPDLARKMGAKVDVRTGRVMSEVLILRQKFPVMAI